MEGQVKKIIRWASKGQFFKDFTVEKWKYKNI